MVFTPPTRRDDDDATKFAYERQKLAMYNHFLRLKPHLFSHVNVEIRHNQNLRNTSAELMDNNIYVRLIATKEFCQQIHCNTHYPRGKQCTNQSEPTIFKSGNSDIQACHASCFNVFDGGVDADGTLYKSPLTIYSERQHKCLLHTDSGFALGIDDYARSDVHPAPRIDTIGTGFDLQKDPYIDKDGNETYKFKLNKYYCDDFGYDFDGTRCKPYVLETINSLFFSENLYKAFQYGYRNFTTGVGSKDIQKPLLSPIAGSAPPKKREWESNINKGAHFFNTDLKLSDLGIMGDYPHLIFTTEYGWPGQIVEPLILNRKPQFKVIDYLSGQNDVVEHLRVNNYGLRKTDEFEILRVYEYMRDVFDEMDNEESSSEDPMAIENFVSGLYHVLGSEEIWLYSSSIFARTILSKMQKLIATSERIFKSATKTVIRVMQRSIMSSLIHRSGHLAIRFFSIAAKAGIGVLKALSVVGLFGDLIGITDIILSHFDLFDLQKIRDENMPLSYSLFDLGSKERAYGFKTVEYSPALFMISYDGFAPKNKNNFFTDEITDAENLKLLPTAYDPPVTYAITANQVQHKDNVVNIFRWSVEYLRRLDTNSDNIPIKWDEEIGIDFETYNKNINKTVESFPETYINYRAFMAETFSRVDKNKYMAIAAVTSLITSVFIPTLFPLLIAFTIVVYAFFVNFHITNKHGTGLQ